MKGEENPVAAKEAFEEGSRETELCSVRLNCSQVKGAVEFTGTGENAGGAETVTGCFLQVYLAIWQMHLFGITVCKLCSRLGVWNYHSS